MASSAGVSAAVADETLIVPLDDEAALDRAFAAHGSEIAAAIVEPLPANYGLLPQRPEWLLHLERLCRRAGALLVPSQDEGSPQCRRLIGRDVPFAMLDSNRMTELKDGDQIEIEAELTRIVKS